MNLINFNLKVCYGPELCWYCFLLRLWIDISAHDLFCDETNDECCNIYVSASLFPCYSHQAIWHSRPSGSNQDTSKQSNRLPLTLVLSLFFFILVLVPASPSFQVNIYPFKIQLQETFLCSGTCSGGRNDSETKCNSSQPSIVK